MLHAYTLVAGLWALVPETEVAEPSPSEVLPRSQSLKNANYRMQVRLEPEARQLIGHQVLTWTNVTKHPVSELRYHLYYNAWRNAESSFLNRPATRKRKNLKEWGPDDWAYVDIKGLRRLNPDQPLALSYEFIAPDDGNIHDRTVMRVPLATPVEPGASIEVELDWVAKVPKTFARTGVRGDYFFLAQWFPKVGVWQPEGQWNCHQFIQTEFFADFGDYEVEISAPEGWVVGATGREVDRRADGEGYVVHRFHQPDVHDFAWTASPLFRVETARFEHEGLPAVDMRLLLMPDHEGQAERYFAATRAALQSYGQWWGAYPYGHITIVDPAYQSGTGGMEYPTFFTGGSRWLSPEASRRPEGVTVHEAGHQFWYGLVANNEFEHAWLDEGFNTYSTTRTMEAHFDYGRHVERYIEGFLPWVFDDIPVAGRATSASGMAGGQSILVRDPLHRHAWLDGPGSYRNNAYTKPALMLRTLENHLGWSVFQRALSTYFERQRFRHPRPESFFSVLAEVSGQDLTWFFDQVYGGTPVFDYAVGEVSSRKLGQPRGHGDDALEFNEGSAGESASFVSTVYLRRWGDGIFPVEATITFKDGTTIDEAWDGKQRWRRLQYQRDSPVVRVDIDPRGVLALDVDRTNNGWVKQSEAKAAARKWGGKWMLWLQHLAEALAIFS